MFLFIIYMVIIIAKITVLYLGIRLRLWLKRLSYKWGFKSKLRRYRVPGDLRGELVNAYSQHINSSLKLPGILSGLRLLRRRWRLGRA